MSDRELFPRAFDVLHNDRREESEALGSSVAGILQTIAISLDNPCESPIEDVVLAQLLKADLCTLPHCKRIEGVTDPPESYPLIEIVPQANLGPYRVDFMVRAVAPDDRECRFIIECDGHDFHQSTKEQVEYDKVRDRNLTLNGYAVLRYTGSEIWSNPEKCSRNLQRVIDPFFKGDKRWKFDALWRDAA